MHWHSWESTEFCTKGGLRSFFIHSHLKEACFELSKDLTLCLAQNEGLINNCWINGKNNERDSERMEEQKKGRKRCRREKGREGGRWPSVAPNVGKYLWEQVELELGHLICAVCTYALTVNYSVWFPPRCKGWRSLWASEKRALWIVKHNANGD